MAIKNKTSIKEKNKSFWSDFRAFATRGNVLDMAVGIIIGAAFSSIVTSLVNILLSLCAWSLPGGISGLVTVLPALNDAQKGVAGIGQCFSNSDLKAMATIYAQSQGYDSSDSTVIQNAENALKSMYTLHGGEYFANSAAIIDWGTFINAIITFVIVAFVLFVIIKAFTKFQARKAAMEAALQEQYFQKHPNERPVAAMVGAPVPTQLDYLKQIRDELKKQNELAQRTGSVSTIKKETKK